MKLGPESDRVLLAHIIECMGRIRQYTGGVTGRHLIVPVWRRTPSCATCKPCRNPRSGSVMDSLLIQILG